MKNQVIVHLSHRFESCTHVHITVHVFMKSFCALTFSVVGYDVSYRAIKIDLVLRLHSLACLLHYNINTEIGPVTEATYMAYLSSTVMLPR